MDKGCEEVVAEVVGVCPWMTEEDVGWCGWCSPSHLRLVTGEVVDMGAMAGALLGLAQRAEEVGDVRRAWVFDQLYAGCVRRCGGRNTTGLSFPRSWQYCLDLLWRVCGGW